MAKFGKICADRWHSPYFATTFDANDPLGMAFLNSFVRSQTLLYGKRYYCSTALRSCPIFTPQALFLNPMRSKYLEQVLTGKIVVSFAKFFNVVSLLQNPVQKANNSV